MSSSFQTRQIAEALDAMAPDGSGVRLLAASRRWRLAPVPAPPGAVSKAVAHRTVEEIWYFTAGRGGMWRKLGEREEITELAQGVSITIAAGVHFQFRWAG